MSMCKLQTQVHVCHVHCVFELFVRAVHRYMATCAREVDSTRGSPNKSPQKVGTGQSEAWTRVHQPLPYAGSAGPEGDPWPSGEYSQPFTLFLSCA